MTASDSDSSDTASGQSMRMLATSSTTMTANNHTPSNPAGPQFGVSSTIPQFSGFCNPHLRAFSTARFGVSTTPQSEGAPSSFPTETSAVQTLSQSTNQPQLHSPSATAPATHQSPNVPRQPQVSQSQAIQPEESRSRATQHQAPFSEKYQAIAVPRTESMLHTREVRVEKNENSLTKYLQLIPGLSAKTPDIHRHVDSEALRTAPLFSQQVKKTFVDRNGPGLGPSNDPLQQYGLLGIRDYTYNCRGVDQPQILSTEDNLIFANTNAPWSTFICGSQGAGKSHSLSCMLENSLLTESPAGVNPKPLAGLVFHYDKFTSHESTQVCEAAYLCSAGIPVRILVSPSNLHAMRRLYRNLPGLPKNTSQPQVMPMYFQENQLSVTRLMTLMAVNEGKETPLYMEVIFKILRDMTTARKGATGFDYLDFKDRLKEQGFARSQQGPLRLRLNLLESFIADRNQSEQSATRLGQMYKSAQGSLTIVDLSCPFVNEKDACALFTICLSIFMENRGDCGRIIALDEAHKFLTASGEAQKLTDQLVSIVRQQRHLAARIIIATQEPTLEPRLLDLCNVSIVHRFSSPAWFKVLRDHLAGARLFNDHSDEELFEIIVGLQTGEALIFCPSAVLDVVDGKACQLKDGFIRARIRSRITADGGQSILASDEVPDVAMEDVPIDEVIRPFTSAESSSRRLVDHQGRITKSRSTGAGAAAVPSNPSRRPAVQYQQFQSRTVGACLEQTVSEMMRGKPATHGLDYAAVRREVEQAAGLKPLLLDEGVLKRWSNTLVSDCLAELRRARKVDHTPGV